MFLVSICVLLSGLFAWNSLSHSTNRSRDWVSQREIASETDTCGELRRASGLRFLVGEVSPERIVLERDARQTLRKLRQNESRNLKSQLFVSHHSAHDEPDPTDSTDQPTRARLWCDCFLARSSESLRCCCV